MKNDYHISSIKLIQEFCGSRESRKLLTSLSCLLHKNFCGSMYFITERNGRSLRQYDNM